jgi:hypothetical protein
LNQQLEERIVNFLRERRESDNEGFPEVTTEDDEALHDIIRHLIELKWGENIHGELPMEFSLCDRTRYESDFTLAIPYIHSTDDVPGVISLIGRNIEIGLDQLRRALLRLK